MGYENLRACGAARRLIRVRVGGGGVLLEMMIRVGFFKDGVEMKRS